MQDETYCLIPLRARDGSLKGEAKVDTEDYERLAQWRWSMDRYGYAYRTITRAEADRTGTSRRVGMHRFILGLKRGDPEVDHINGEPTDNRKVNLRLGTHAENQQNRHGGHGTSRYRGVSWHPQSGLWSARVMIDGKVHSLRYHKTEAEAAAAVVAFLREHSPYSTD
jgi:hypothetical protein